MSGQTSSTTTRTRRLAAAAAALLGAAVTAFASGVAAEPAQAWTHTNNGCPGTVQVPTINGYQSFGPAFEFPQRYAWRSQCYSGYTQVISIRYRLVSFNFQTGRWEFYTQTTRTASVGSGYAGVWMKGWGGGSLRGAISGDVLVEWRLTNGALIGSTYIDHNAVGDYSCPGGGCRIYSDSEVGAYIRF